MAGTPTPDPMDPISLVRAWIFERGQRGCDPALTSDSNLLEEGYLDSLGLIGLIVFVENLRGAPIGENDMSPQSFSTLRRIEATFFNGKGGA